MKDNPLQFKQYALQGVLFGLLPVSILAIFTCNPLMPGNSGIAAGVLAAVLLLTGVSLIFKYRRTASLLCCSGILLDLFLLFFELRSNPLLALLCLLLSIAAFYYLATAQLYPAAKMTAALQFERVLGCSGAGIFLSLLAPLQGIELEFFPIVCSGNLFILLILTGQYLKYQKYFHKPKKIVPLLFAAGLVILLLTCFGGAVTAVFIVSPVVFLLVLKHKHTDLKYLELIMAHPARCLVVTFLGLCIGGTLLLRTPLAMNGELSLHEAAFTAVSAVCVTGLTVIDISEKLTVCGQFYLLVLIQLGGLGIMTLTTLVLHSVGKLSLGGEQLITELTHSAEQDVFDSLRLILRVTFGIELAGALLLIICFFNHHGDFLLALRQGIFTSVSAFCNAGFFPGSNSLIPFAGEKLLLIIVACEIITGGIAPAVVWSLIRMRRNKPLPVISKLVLTTTGILVFGGTLLLALFEWNGIFKDLLWHDKWVNAFFQSVTLRTAGFNTVPFTALGGPAYLIMIIFMFIGGSPGGTAGGIKTTTLAVLFLSFRAAVRNEDAATVGYRRIVWQNIIQAVAVFMAAALVLLLIVIMLIATQSLDAGDLIFEAVSALATVGLSLDCTGELDPVGCLIIMAAMFIGRIGPLTLFCFFLSERQNRKQVIYPQIKIPLG